MSQRNDLPPFDLGDLDLAADRSPDELLASDPVTPLRIAGAKPRGLAVPDVQGSPAGDLRLVGLRADPSPTPATGSDDVPATGGLPHWDSLVAMLSDPALSQRGFVLSDTDAALWCSPRSHLNAQGVAIYARLPERVRGIINRTSHSLRKEYGDVVMSSVVERSLLALPSDPQLLVSAMAEHRPIRRYWQFRGFIATSLESDLRDLLFSIQDSLNITISLTSLATYATMKYLGEHA
ncbi:hypothetical protein [Ferrimicrobium acidiphilum]|uniref:hypothetical protein n=1 Tax=Ferrimicrobium acidiphilum TaxID=121039 RepID=UPI0023F34962|nr:hypothetical protein [Ferrimicrobium acidiphilum]